MRVGCGGEIFRVGDATDDDELVGWVVDEATHVFVTLGTTCIDGPNRIFTLGCHLRAEEAHE